jgi:hypothetical protein
MTTETQLATANEIFLLGAPRIVPNAIGPDRMAMLGYLLAVEVLAAAEPDQLREWRPVALTEAEKIRHALDRRGRNRRK